MYLVTDMVWDSGRFLSKDHGRFRSKPAMTKVRNKRSSDRKVLAFTSLAIAIGFYVNLPGATTPQFLQICIGCSAGAILYGIMRQWDCMFAALLLAMEAAMPLTGIFLSALWVLLFGSIGLIFMLFDGFIYIRDALRA